MPTHLVSGLPHSLATEIFTELGSESLAQVASSLPETLKTVQYGELSNAEMDVLRALAKGQTMAKTAADLYVSVNTLKTHRLYLSENTLKFHRRSIYRKLQVTTRDAAVLRGIQLEII